MLVEIFISLGVLIVALIITVIILSLCIVKYYKKIREWEYNYKNLQNTLKLLKKDDDDYDEDEYIDEWL